jgi:hypothetical protein
MKITQYSAFLAVNIKVKYVLHFLSQAMYGDEYWMDYNNISRHEFYFCLFQMRAKWHWHGFELLMKASDNIRTTLIDSRIVVVIFWRIENPGIKSSSWLHITSSFPNASFKLDCIVLANVLEVSDTDNYSLINKPTFLKPFSVIDCTVEEPDIWYPELIEGLNTEIKHRKQLTEPPSLANDKEYHFVTFIDSESSQDTHPLFLHLNKISYPQELEMTHHQTSLVLYMWS